MIRNINQQNSLKHSIYSFEFILTEDHPRFLINDTLVDINVVSWTDHERIIPEMVDGLIKYCDDNEVSIEELSCIIEFLENQ